MQHLPPPPQNPVLPDWFPFWSALVTLVFVLPNLLAAAFPSDYNLTYGAMGCVSLVTERPARAASRSLTTPKLETDLADNLEK